jgi:lipoate-protein ligase A
VEALPGQGQLSAQPRWPIARHRGAASTFHAFEPTAQRSAWWLEVDRPALVLGSTQPPSVVDHDACSAAGVEVVRRRSGGGVVVLIPGQCAWLDVVVPYDDVLWDDDIGRSMWWFGDVWAKALIDLGCADVQVHHGPVQRSAWSQLVCFDGLGAGEVTIGGRKAVGISQRRTRRWARLQSSIHLGDATSPSPSQAVVPLLAPPRPSVDQLAPPAVLDMSAATLQAAIERALDQF